MSVCHQHHSHPEPKPQHWNSCWQEITSTWAENRDVKRSPPTQTILWFFIWLGEAQAVAESCGTAKPGLGQGSPCCSSCLRKMLSKADFIRCGHALSWPEAVQLIWCQHSLSPAVTPLRRSCPRLKWPYMQGRPRAVTPQHCWGPSSHSVHVCEQQKAPWMREGDALGALGPFRSTLGSFYLAPGHTSIKINAFRASSKRVSAPRGNFQVGLHEKESHPTCL